MKVAIDLTALMPLRSGVDRYLLELVRAVARVDAENRYTLFVNREDRALVSSLPSNFSVVAASRRARIARLVFQQVGLPVAAVAGRADVVHSPSFIIPFLRGRGGHLLTVHDLTSFTRPECHTLLRRSLAYRAALALSIRRADRIHVPSDFVCGEIRRLFGPGAASRTVVIPHGIDDRFGPAAGARSAFIRAKLGLPEHYVLYVGTLEPRKNLGVLLDAYARARADGGLREHLVLAGRFGWGNSELLQALNKNELHGKVHLTGWVGDEDLPALYAGARAFVYPSLEEGFGFPPLEAMATGVPTISTDTSSLRENLAGAAELVPPRDVSALAAAMRRVLSDAPYRARLRRAGLERTKAFRWEECARATVRCYEELVRAQGAQRPEAVGTLGG